MAQRGLCCICQCKVSSKFTNAQISSVPEINECFGLEKYHLDPYDKLCNKCRLKLMRFRDSGKKPVKNCCVNLTSNDTESEEFRLKYIATLNDLKILKKELDQMKTKIKILEAENKRLNNICTVTGNYLNKEQEVLFTNFVKCKEGKIGNIIEAKNIRGPSKKLLILEASRKDSKSSSKSTIRKRSKFLEIVETATCGGKEFTDLQKQNLIKRNKQQYIDVLKNMNIIPKENQLSVTSMQFLKSELPWNQLRLINKTIQKEIGVKLINELKLRDHLMENSYNFNHGILNINSENVDDIEVPYAIVDDVEALLIDTIKKNSEFGNFHHIEPLNMNEAWILLTGI